MTDSSIEKRFGELVRDLRIKKRLNQEDFASYLGIDRSYQGRIERGIVSVTIGMQEVIAKGLGLRVGELMTMLDQRQKQAKVKPGE